MADAAGYNKRWNKGFVAGVGAARAGTDAEPISDDEAWNEGFRSGVRAEQRTRRYRAQQAQPAEPVTVMAVFDEAALKSLDLRIEEAVQKVLYTSVATAEFNDDFWQRLQQIIKPPDITIHNHPPSAPHDETLEKLREYSLGTRFIRTEDGLVVEEP